MIIDGLPLLGAPASGDEIPIERGTTTYKIDYDALATAIINKLGGDPVTAAHGGTGITANPSMLVNLAGGNAVGVFQANPRPGVTGVLPAANGGTGQTSLQATRNAMGLGNTTGALPIASGGTGASTVAGALTALGAYSKAEVDGLTKSVNTFGQIGLSTTLKLTDEMLGAKLLVIMLRRYGYGAAVPVIPANITGGNLGSGMNFIYNSNTWYLKFAQDGTMSLTGPAGSADLFVDVVIFK